MPAESHPPGKGRLKRAEPVELAERAERQPNRIKRWLMVLGPGFITGASDDDPSGVATYAVAGAAFGFATLWLTLLCLPLMAAVQYISAKIGMVRGEGLASTLSERYPGYVVYPAILVLAVANIITAGADIGAVGAAIHLIVPIPIAVTIAPIGLGILLLQMFGSYRLISSVFKWLSLFLLAYVATAFFVRADALEVLRGSFVPTVRTDSKYIATVVAILGTTISPYLWFWQSSQEVDEEKAQGRRTLRQRRGASDAELRYEFWDINAGMLFSEFVAYFIIFTTAATLHNAGETGIGTATDAARALEPLAGEAAPILLGIGLIGSGLLAVPVVTGAAAYTVAETMGWHSSLDESPRVAWRFYGVIAVSTVIAIAINFIGVNPIDALFYAAVINGLLAPPLLMLIMAASNDPGVMDGRPNGTVVNTLGWLTTLIMTAGAVFLIVTWLR